MNSLDAIRVKLRRLYNTDPHIRINVSMMNPRINLKNEQVTITGVYPHIFQIEERSSGSPKKHTLQYSDVLIGHIEILDTEQRQADDK